MRKLPPLNAIRAFEAVARKRSFSAAAQELSVTTTAISHQIRHLEELLGQKLLDRNTRNVALSPAGERMFPLLQEGLDRLADAFEEINAQKSGGTISVTTTRAFAERWLMPRLMRFREAQPEIIINVDASEAVSDLRTSGVDVAIRYGRKPDGSLPSFTLFEDVYVPVVARALTNGRTPVISDFKDRPLLGFQWKNPALGGPTWAAWIAAAKADSEKDFRYSWFSEEHLALQALDHAHGPLLASNVMVGSGLASGAYARIDGPSLPGLIFSVVMAPTAGRKPSVRAFVDWLRAEGAETSQKA